jgi:hypothetical protein
LKNQIENIEGRSTSNEETPEYFGTKATLSSKNENIMCDNRFGILRIVDFFDVCLNKVKNYPNFT